MVAVGLRHLGVIYQGLHLNHCFQYGSIMLIRTAVTICDAIQHMHCISLKGKKVTFSFK